MRFALVVARFNGFITESLAQGAVDCIKRHGGRDADIVIAHVPGSFELPLICRDIASRGKVDAVIALGAVIRGATSHYDLVCNEAARGVAQATLETSVPILFGVITTENIEQAIERAGTKAGNKGAEAALAAIEMVSLRKRLVEEGI